MKRKIISLCFLGGLLAPTALIAQEGSIAQASGISDTVLLSLMIGVILMLLLIIQALSNAIKSISKSSKLEEKIASSGAAKALATLFLLGGSLTANAANESASSAFVMDNTMFWILTTLIIVLGIVVFVLFRALQTLIKLEQATEEETVEETADIFETLNLTDNVPIEEEGTIMLDHDYDGIKELDNNLPPWWVYMFYATIIFAVVYVVRFHITGSGQLQEAEYLAQMAEAEEAKAELMANATDMITEDNVVFLVDAPSIEKGAAIYKGNCATCHGQLGEGGAGPNLTDEYWIHGGSAQNVFSTIKYGVPAKGMIAWQSQFSPTQMQQVASYIKTLVGTNPPNGKDPQGELYIEEAEAPAEEESDSTATETQTDTLQVAELNK